MQYARLIDTASYEMNVDNRSQEPTQVSDILSEKRKFDRYSIEKQATLSFGELENQPAQGLLVHDLSCGGALVSSDTRIPEDTVLTLSVKVERQQDWFGKEEVEFLFRGKVIRKEKSGKVAIHFEKDYRINTH